MIATIRVRTALPTPVRSGWMPTSRLVYGLTGPCSEFAPRYSRASTGPTTRLSRPRRRRCAYALLYQLPAGNARRTVRLSLAGIRRHTVTFSTSPDIWRIDPHPMALTIDSNSVSVGLDAGSAMTPVCSLLHTRSAGASGMARPIASVTFPARSRARHPPDVFDRSSRRSSHRAITVRRPGGRGLRPCAKIRDEVDRPAGSPP